MQRFRTYIARTLTELVPVLILIGCSSTPPLPHDDSSHRTSSASSVPVLPPAGSGRGGYYQDDGPGDHPPENLDATPDAEPKIEPYSAKNNRPYVVFGKTYVPIVDNKPFKERGIGSWYGKKFHGQKTSSGELYDMYKMTAAHPTLPIPSYARVTNLANGKQVIVRINDRGPFHPGRIIDLSYTAALKLGYLASGSSELEVDRLLPDDIARMQKEKREGQIASDQNKQSPIMPLPVAAPSTPPSASQTAIEAMLRNDTNPLPSQVGTTQQETATAKPASIITATSSAPATTTGNYYIQLGAYSQADRAESMRTQLMQQSANNLPTIKIAQSNALYRLLCGPFSTKEEAAAAAEKIEKVGATKPLIVQR
jgi:rare lipoprotein A